jgi:O-antigen/teichoic acid export membrane protein
LTAHNHTLLSRGLLQNFGNSLYFFAPSILTLLVNLFTAPVFARNLSLYDFAVIGYFASIQSIFLPVLNLSLFPYYMREFHTRTELENTKVLHNIVIFLSAVNLITIAIGICIVSVFFSAAHVGFPLFPYLIFSLFTAYFSIYSSSITLNYKMQKNGLKYALFSGIPSIVNILLGLLFVVALQWGASGKMGAMMSAQAVVGGTAFMLLYRKGTAVDFTIIKDALKLGFPLIIGSLLEFPILYLDRILLEPQHDVAQLGLYNIGLTFSGYMLMMNAAIFQAFEPDMYRFVSQKMIKGLLVTVGAVFGVMFLSNVMFSLFSRPIVSILTSGRYTDAYAYANIFIWSDMLLHFSYFLAIFFIVAGETKLLLYRKMMIAAMSGAIFYYAIQHWGFAGAAYAKIVVNFVNCLLLVSFLFFARKVRYVEIVKLFFSEA